MIEGRLILRAPARRAAELAWVAEQLIGRFLGLPWQLQLHDAQTVELHADGGCVEWPDVFLAQADAHWREPGTLPALPLAQWPLPDTALRERLGATQMPLLFGDGRYARNESRVRLPVDVTGTAFFLLSRYEEAVHGAATDRHGRFPGAASLMQRAGLIRRPLVDELVELLWWALAPLAPGLQRRRREPRSWVSCDVDLPYLQPGLPALRHAAASLLHERNPRLAGQALCHAVAGAFGVSRFDPCDNVDWMLEANERAGHRVTFFFLSLRQPQRIDGHYRLDTPRIAGLLKRLLDRGHGVGLHGSYHSADDAALRARELADLREAVARAGGDPSTIGARQHYLRWRTPGTAQALEALGLAYDSTLGFADAPGFRSGTCHPYALFDLEQRRPMALIERPLVLMEASVISRSYLGLGHGDAALALMLDLKATCARFGGEFSLLWHNSNLGHPAARAMYLRLLEPQQ